MEWGGQPSGLFLVLREVTRQRAVSLEGVECVSITPNGLLFSPSRYP